MTGVPGGVELVWLWTDAAMQGLALALAVWAWHLWRSPAARLACRRALSARSAMAAAVVLGALAGVALLDSVHLRRGAQAPIESLLEVALSRPRAMRETSYSRPLAWQGFSRETVAVAADGTPVRDFPRLLHGGAHLVDPSRQWRGDVLLRGTSGAVLAVLAMLVLAAVVRRWRRGRPPADGPAWPLRTAWGTATLLAVLVGVGVALGGHYHLLGTDRTGQDVCVQALRSVRTAWVIGVLASVATLPLALGLGLWAGWRRGRVDAAVQYLCAVLQAVPNVLLIAAGVLLAQFHIDRDPDRYASALERADAKVFLLCLLLGATGWTGLCRLVRARVRQVAALEFVQAATGLGLGPWRLVCRHVLPQILPVVLVTTVLDVSALVLYEAVLSFVGLGVDPAFDSFGSMVHAARAEWTRTPLVWWPMSVAFVGMVTLVLALNLLADGVREAGDPHAPR